MTFRQLLELTVIAAGLSLLGAYAAYGAEPCVTPKDNAKIYGPAGRSWYGEDAEIFLREFGRLVGEPPPWEFKIWGVTIHLIEDEQKRPQMVAKFYGTDGCDTSIGANLNETLLERITSVIGKRA